MTQTNSRTQYPCMIYKIHSQAIIYYNLSATTKQSGHINHMLSPILKINVTTLFNVKLLKSDCIRTEDNALKKIDTQQCTQNV